MSRSDSLSSSDMTDVIEEALTMANISETGGLLQGQGDMEGGDTGGDLMFSYLWI